MTQLSQQDRNIASKLKGIREITLVDGTKLKILFSVGAIIELNGKYGSLKNVFSEFQKGDEMDFNVLLDLVWEGAKAFQPEVNRKELSHKMDFFDFETTTQELFGGLEDALPSE